MKFDEERLTAGQYRKLEYLRKSLGEKIGNRTFYRWLKTQGVSDSFNEDAAVLANLVEQLVRDGTMRLPHGGFLVLRGRGRVIVRRPK